MARAFMLALIVVFVIAIPAFDRLDVGIGWRARRTEPRAASAPERPAARGASQKTREKKPTDRFDDYQIPAGSVLAAALQVTVDSALSAIGDQADATLAEAVTRDGLVLLPAGSVVRGSVVDALAASPRAPRGRIAIAFFVIEHATTGSRAAIKTRPIVVDASSPTGKRPLDVQLAAGHRIHVILSQPLVVRIPK